MSAFDILAMQDTPKWPSLDHAKPVWQRLKHVLFSKQVEVRLACLCRRKTDSIPRPLGRLREAARIRYRLWGVRYQKTSPSTGKRVV
jgi:hypothetical protein